jgi:hypothetical protein
MKINITDCQYLKFWNLFEQLQLKAKIDKTFIGIHLS